MSPSYKNLLNFRKTNCITLNQKSGEQLINCLDIIRILLRFKILATLHFDLSIVLGYFVNHCHSNYLSKSKINFALLKCLPHLLL